MINAIIYRVESLPFIELGKDNNVKKIAYLSARTGVSCLLSAHGVWVKTGRMILHDPIWGRAFMIN
jgi:hypothetical protein